MQRVNIPQFEKLIMGHSSQVNEGQPPSLFSMRLSQSVYPCSPREKSAGVHSWFLPPLLLILQTHHHIDPAGVNNHAQQQAEQCSADKYSRTGQRQHHTTD